MSGALDLSPGIPAARRRGPILGGDPLLAGLVGLVLAAALGLVLLPPAPYLVNMVGQLAAFAILAVSLDLVWGYLGILSLGHGLFFAIGGYAGAMLGKWGGWPPALTLAAALPLGALAGALVTAATLRLRDDVVNADPLTGGGIREQVLANAPVAEHGFFAVPKVIE